MENRNQTNTFGATDMVVSGFDVTPKNVILTVVLVIIVVITIVGNLLVLLAFAVERRLRHPFNMFIFNLAVTDFLVAITAMSFYTVDSLLGYWPFGSVICGIWIYFDFAMTFASVFTLVAISVDRFWCVTWALHYKIHNTWNKMVILLVVIWFCVFALWTPPFIYDRMKLSNGNSRMCIWEPSNNSEFVIFVAVLGHYIPCIIMFSCYFKVYHVMKRQATLVGVNYQRAPHSQGKTTCGAAIASVSNTNHAETINYLPFKHLTSPTTVDNVKHSTNPGNLISPQDTHTGRKMEISSLREKRIFITLSYVLFSYLICWLPLYIAFDINAWKPELVPSDLYTVLFWTAYINSTLNPFIYAYTNNEFRQGFIKVLKCLCNCRFENA